MKYKLFFGISVFNVLLIILVIAYGVTSKLVNFDVTVIDIFRYIIIGLAIGTPLLWTLLMYFVDCPHCGDKALPLMNERSIEPTEPSLPVLFRLFSFMVNKEYFAGYCHCISCQEKIIFKENLTEVCDEKTK